MPSEIEVEFEVAPEPLQCVRSDAHDTGALYVQTILSKINTCISRRYNTSTISL